MRRWASTLEHLHHEGVETAAQARFFLDEGCPGAQGYYDSRPLAADEITGRLHDQGLARGAPGL